MGPLQVPSAGFALARAGSLDWGDKTRHIENRERGGALALGGRHLVKKSNNLQIVSGNNGRDDGEGVRLGRSIWGGYCLFVRGVKSRDKKIQK